MSTFWATHQVGGPYSTLEESENALRERALLYPTLEDLMPTHLPGKTILDYGCGPGHDTLLFLEHGAGHVFYDDTSELALKIVEERLALHGLADRATAVDLNWKFVHFFHYIHCAGVLHHTEDPPSILRKFHQRLHEDGELRVMIYDGDLSTHTQSEVPITHWWTQEEFSEMARVAGFGAQYVGSYPCSAPWRPNCYAACYRCLPYQS